MEQESPRIYTYKCRYCGKIIQSLYKKQGEINFATHLLSCKRKKKVEEIDT